MMLKSISILIFIFLISSCEKEKTFETKEEYHELIDGNICLIYLISYSTRINNTEIISNYFNKKSNQMYFISNNFYSIDSIQTLLGSNQVLISPLYYRDKSNIYTTSHIRKAISLTSDSIIGEYYNSYYYSHIDRWYHPDSGFFAIKIK